MIPFLRGQHKLQDTKRYGVVRRSRRGFNEGVVKTGIETKFSEREVKEMREHERKERILEALKHTFVSWSSYSGRNLD